MADGRAAGIYRCHKYRCQHKPHRQSPMKPPRAHPRGDDFSLRALPRRINLPEPQISEKSPKSRDLLGLLIVPFRPAAPEPLTLE